jgi:hypothetical protein
VQEELGLIVLVKCLFENHYNIQNRKGAWHNQFTKALEFGMASTLGYYFIYKMHDIFCESSSQEQEPSKY